MIAFRLFSLLFAYPAPDVMESIRKLSEDKSISKFESVGLLGSINIEDLQAEYTSLFVNSYPTLTCPPYESFYREGTLYGSAVSEVKDIYREYRLEYIYAGEPPDHISVELDFLAETGDENFKNRMQEWIPQFVEAVKKNSTTYGVFAGELECLLAS